MDVRVCASATSIVTHRVVDFDIALQNGYDHPSRLTKKVCCVCIFRKI